MLNKNRSVLITIIACALSINIAFAGPIEDCKEFSRLGIPGKQGELLCRKGFLIAHSPEHKTPLWVIEYLTAEKANGNLPRYDKFQPDPDLKEGTRAEISDYRGSGYDRGHMAPAADMKWDQQAMVQCFYLSNMIPQVGKGMNQGIWKDLEEYVRTWALDRGALYIFTGPIYEGGINRTIGKNKVAVPSHVYKIVYDPFKAEAIAFIMPNEKLDTADIPTYIVTIREVESKTGLDFLSDMDKQVQEVIENKKAQRLW